MVLCPPSVAALAHHAPQHGRARSCAPFRFLNALRPPLTGRASVSDHLHAPISRPIPVQHDLGFLGRRPMHNTWNEKSVFSPDDPSVVERPPTTALPIPVNHFMSIRRGGAEVTAICRATSSEQRFVPMSRRVARCMLEAGGTWDQSSKPLLGNTL
ncbi:hypothetical protein P154DRAFT_222847 [Amniculicola lignicola CBS 123094]|uniref:Uncharacterized protein n=1 Tax=Amniculicola lignicola CBS 123094 TaxID=1392246 RepID=A0A6A5X078_9PLEO|nr:hypothetical protein P154DRAFT_222847 [Amniculicola lignicola CBS 123094]